MPVALETFVKQLSDSGVIAPGKLEKFIPPQAIPKDAQELTRQLVESKTLTKFQAEEFYQGRAKSLILGNYTILDKIGAGGMGQVFKAEHRRMHRIVAIKLLPQNMIKDAASVARFQREVEVAAKLEHPNIVTAYDADEANGIHFLVMQYVDGRDLSALVRANGPLPVANAVNYIEQAARGLEFAHGEGVIHRDIKPGNLLLDKKGTVKILDMGLARIEAGGDAATQAELTGTGAVMGTVDYMSPEQALDTKHADARADVYSLGCSMFYLLTGKPPYDGESSMAKLLAHREKPIPSLGAKAPEQLQAIFEKMVAKNVEDRYQTVIEVVAALEQCSLGQLASNTVELSAGTTANRDIMTLLRNVLLNPVKRSKAKPKAAPAKTREGKRKYARVALGTALLGLALLTGVIVMIQTKDGTLVVEVDQPDAVVELLTEEGMVEISRPGEKGTVSVVVAPGKHRLKVEKDGFEFFAQDFVMESSGRQSIKATLEPIFKNPTLNDPAFRKWVKDVAKLPPGRQLQSVVKKLQELNPDFDGKGTHKIVYGGVTELQFNTDSVEDISPVRALPGLKTLICRGTRFRKGKLSDLSPLQGMLLTGLDFESTQVSDLSPLKDMPLTFLICHSTLVSQLSALQGMPLTDLDCAFTPVSDLSPLKGMPLTTLDVSATQVPDLSPLMGMRLGHLSYAFTPVSDLSPLKGMPLQFLNCEGTKVADLSLLRGMPLTELHFNNTQVSDLTPLKDLPLAKLHCHGSRVSDLSPLEGMNLGEFTFTPKNITKGLDLVRQMKSIQSIGLDYPHRLAAGDFWNKYDAGMFSK